MMAAGGAPAPPRFIVAAKDAGTDAAGLNRDQSGAIHMAMPQSGRRPDARPPWSVRAG
jgi:hypothetical protein